MALKQPPFCNGCMMLTDTDTKVVQDKLVAIRDAFVPTDEQEVCDTFYITSTYNKTNALKINGDTCEMLLAEEQPPTEVI